jgi:hypothetical protein
MDLESVSDTLDSLEELQIAPGTMLRAVPARDPALAFDLQFVGLMGGKGVLVEPQGVACLKQGLRTDADFHVSGFTGQHDFAFDTKVMRVFDFTFREPPLAYALLSYPERIAAKRVRRARRVRTNLPARVAVHGESAETAVVVRDLSIAGALLESPTPPGSVGTELVLRLDIDFEGEPLAIALPATICRVDVDESCARTGVLFQDVLRADKLAVHYLVHSSLAG